MSATYFPTIDYGTCIADQACIEACPAAVLLWNDTEGQVQVEAPDKCIDACKACLDVCPVESISFPG